MFRAEQKHILRRKVMKLAYAYGLRPIDILHLLGLVLSDVVVNDDDWKVEV